MIYWNVFLTPSRAINLVPSDKVGSPKGNDSEVLEKTGCWKNSVLYAHVDWLIAVCHSVLGDSLIWWDSICGHEWPWKTRFTGMLLLRVAILWYYGQLILKLSGVVKSLLIRVRQQGENVERNIMISQQYLRAGGFVKKHNDHSVVYHLMYEVLLTKFNLAELLTSWAARRDVSQSP